MTAPPLSLRPLGRSGLRVSPLGLASGFGAGADAVERAYHELGINYFHVGPGADSMIDGLKRLIRAGHRDRLVIAGGAKIPLGVAVSREWEAQARALGIERFDVWLLYWVRAGWYVTGKTWPAMQRLKEQGRVGALAVSCHDRPLALRLVSQLALDVLMIRYNAAHRGAETEIFDKLGQPRPGIIAYTATRWGRLLAPIDGHGAMTAPECYRFALGRSDVDLCLTGAASWDELRENAAGVTQGPLSPERLREVRAFGDAVRGTLTGRIGFGGY